MKLNEISLDFFKQKEAESSRPVQRANPELIEQLTKRIEEIADSNDYELTDEAFEALDRAIAPYKVDDDDEEIPARNYDRVSHELSDVGVKHVLDRVSNTHYGAGRLEKLEKELDDISKRINIH